MPKRQVNVHLSTHTIAQLKALTANLGMSEGQVVSLAVDRLAEGSKGMELNNQADALYEQVLEEEALSEDGNASPATYIAAQEAAEAAEA